ncbi:uncharacterized protein LOC131549132 [Onychostoma macrolepis]|uniref:uncharacterized protein LOC131549132 n=1 Tax=Onychostoma macrolepis TaxID=369639 RepID=UPI00272A00A4|nr:uncharacterized protein LOC131549132 [Onychostoma macrolepis]
MVWLLTIILGLPLLQQPVSTQPISHNNLSIQAIGDFPKNLPASHNTNWIEESVDNRFTKDLLLPLLPNSSINEGSGEGSGIQQSLEVMLPSTGLLEMDMLIPDRAEKQDFDMQELGAHPAPPTPLKLTQHIDEDDQDIILENNNSASGQATSTMAVQLTTHIHTNNNERLNKDQPLLTTIKPITETNSTGKSPVNMHLVTFSIDIEVNNKEDMEASQDTEYVASTQSLSSTTKPEMLGNNGTLVTQSGSIQGFLDLTVGEERYGTNHSPAATPRLQTGKEGREETTSDLPVGSSSTTNRATDYSKNKDDKKPKWFGSLFGLLNEHNLSDVIGTCILGPCVVSTGGNVTRLQFGWGWWLGQLSARLLELAWSFSLLLLGSQVFWKPQGSKQTAKRAGKRKPVSRWNRLLDRLPTGPWRRPDRNWAELLPNNWKDHKQSHANVNHSVIRNQATPATSIMTVHDNAGGLSEGVLYSSSYDHYASPLWTSGVEWQEHECFLSLIEFDLCPPSPVNLHHSIDKALHHAHMLGVGTLFTPSAPSWTQNEGSGGLLCDNVVSPSSPTNKAYRWALDNGLSPNSPQHLGNAVQQTQVSVIEPLDSLTPETVRKVWERDMAIPRVTVDDDRTSIASEDDVTSF